MPGLVDTVGGPADVRGPRGGADRSRGWAASVPPSRRPPGRRRRQQQLTGAGAGTDDVCVGPEDVRTGQTGPALGPTTPDGGRATGLTTPGGGRGAGLTNLGRRSWRGPDEPPPA